MTQARVNRISAWVPLLCSTLAFAVVMANIIARVPPQPDENASAHLWQLLMVVQLPFVAVFVATADWREWRRPAMFIALQAAAVLAAAVPVFLAGY
jgi:cell division protein FtsW (lipid II flippase)